MNLKLKFNQHLDLPKPRLTDLNKTKTEQQGKGVFINHHPLSSIYQIQPLIKPNN